MSGMSEYAEGRIHGLTEAVVNLRRGMLNPDGSPMSQAEAAAALEEWRLVVERIACEDADRCAREAEAAADRREG